MGSRCLARIERWNGYRATVVGAFDPNLKRHLSPSSMTRSRSGILQLRVRSWTVGSGPHERGAERWHEAPWNRSDEGQLLLAVRRPPQRRRRALVNRATAMASEASYSSDLRWSGLWRWSSGRPPALAARIRFDDSKKFNTNKARAAPSDFHLIRLTFSTQFELIGYSQNRLE